MPVRPPTAELRCSFCNKPESQVKKLITSRKAAICDACVRMSAEAVQRSESERIFPVAPPEWVPDASDPVVGRAQERFRGLVEQALEKTQTEIRLERARQRDPRPVAVIPSRYASTRLPAKPLALLAGRPMVEHVHERCVRSGAFARVVVATDDERIASAVRGFGGEVVMTSPRCKSGTDRVAEAAAQLPEVEWLVNVQGDEPLIPLEALRSIAAAFADPEVEMATLVRPLEEGERANPAVVKVALARNGDALYFSRADLPFERDAGTGHPPRYGHLGLYGYRRDALMKLAQLPPSPLEETEKLEQLRALECGIRIRCLMTLQASFGIDTPDDLTRAEKLLAAGATG